MPLRLISSSFYPPCSTPTPRCDGYPPPPPARKHPHFLERRPPEARHRPRAPGLGLPSCRGGRATGLRQPSSEQAPRPSRSPLPSGLGETSHLKPPWPPSLLCPPAAHFLQRTSADEVRPRDAGTRPENQRERTGPVVLIFSPHFFCPHFLQQISG